VSASSWPIEPLLEPPDPELAVSVPVGPGAPSTRNAPSEVAEFPPFEATSYFSLMTAGGVVELLPLVPKKPSSAAPELVVSSDGAVIADVPGVYLPECASTGRVASTPVRASIPPAPPTDMEKLHVSLVATSEKPSILT
jgi:hypothetical protein